MACAGALDAGGVERLRNESQAAARLDHPHIVHVYGVGCERGVHYFAMQYIEGRSLAEVIAGMKGTLGELSVDSCQLSVLKSASPDVALGCASRLNGPV